MSGYLTKYTEENLFNVEQQFRQSIFEGVIAGRDIKVGNIVQNITLILIKETGDSPPKIIKIDWREVCRKVLTQQQKNQQLRKKATELGFELNFYVPLGLVERKQQQCRRASDDVEREKVYQPSEEVITKEYKHDTFLKEVIGVNSTDNKHVAIVGEPGVGKTTLLIKIADWIDKNEKGLPICISLANLQKKSSEDNILKGYILDNWLDEALNFIDSEARVYQDAVKESLKERFRDGGVWLLLDGLDEMTVSSSSSVLENIKSYLSDWVAQARVALTSRLNVWDFSLNNPLANFQTYRTLEFSQEDVEKFINSWFAPANHELLGTQLQAELEESQYQRVRELVKNPLRLALLCQTWYYNQGNLPETRARLYKRFVRDFYHEWKSQLHQITWTEKKELNKALGELALAGINSQTRFRLGEELAYEVMGEPLFKSACDWGWLNLIYRDAETNAPVYAFFHPSFQEYFAATAIDDWHFFLPRDYVDEQIEEQEYRIFKSQWKEVVLLWLGRDDIAKEEKEKFINALVKIDREVYEHQPYFLAVEGINEFREYSKKSEIIQQVIEWRYDSNTSEAIRFLAQIYFGKIEQIEDNRPEIIAGLVKLIDSINNNNNYSRKKNLLDAALKLWEFDPGNERLISALANVINPDYVYPEQHTSKYLRAVEYLGIIGVGNEQAVSALVRSISSHAYILKYTHGFGYHYNLVQKLLWQEVASLVKIGVGNKQATTIFVDWIASNTTNLPILKLAAYILGKIGVGNEQAISAVVNLIKSSTDRFTLNLAVEILGDIGVGNKQAIFALVELIDSVTEEDTLILAATSFWKIGVGKEQAISGLGKLINCIVDESFLLHIAKSLLKLDPGNKQAISALFKLISCADQKIGMQATEIFKNYELNRIKER